MANRKIIVGGGISFIVGAVSFVAVFSYLAANFNYPAILDGSAAEVLPQLLRGGPSMRTVRAVYAFLPLLLIPGAVGAYFVLPRARPCMLLALIFVSIGASSMCLGLMRWPSVHWVLAEAYVRSGSEAQNSIEAVFVGLNLYLGDYIGEFLGEICLAFFFLLTGVSMTSEPLFPKWLGWCGTAFGLLFIVGALRTALQAVQPIADINNFLLPL